MGARDWPSSASCRQEAGEGREEEIMDIDKALDAMRQQCPLVHCITNYVAMNVAANTLLAAGASPAMIHCAEEAGEFAAIAGALSVNIGTISPPWFEGMQQAVKAADAAGKPWVLDPVAHFATTYRARAARDLLQMKPAILRGNASEIMALAGGMSSGRGVDAGDPVAMAESGARSLARDHGIVVAVSGATDFITDGERGWQLTGGSERMPQVTAIGCSLTCLMAAFAAVVPPAEAAVAASCMFKEAGERAAARAEGPGSLGWRFSDALAAIQPGELFPSGRLTEV